MFDYVFLIEKNHPNQKGKPGIEIFIVKVFFKVAEEYNIPANAIDLSNPAVAEHFKKAGYPIDENVIESVKNYKLPKLDFFSSVPKGKTYEEKREKFINHVKELPAGLTEIIFHPSVESENLKTITNSWQQRVWEAQLFSDPIVKQYFIDEDIVFTNLDEIITHAEDTEALINYLDILLTNGMLKDDTRQIITTIVDPMDDMYEKVKLTIYLMVISADYTILK